MDWDRLAVIGPAQIGYSDRLRVADVVGAPWACG
jgi:hypothetical protein